jgi:hypothetical protein
MSNSVNHRRKNKAKVALRHTNYDNGYSIPTCSFRGEYSPTMHEIESTDPTESYQRVGKTRYLDKSLHSWSRKSEFADVSIGAAIGNDFSNGHRGMAHSVKGAKKFVRTRIRFHENAATQKLKDNYDEED